MENKIMQTNIFSVTDFGAVPNSQAVQTDAFQKALDACFLAGGGEVAVPAGSYITGDIRIRSNTTLHLLENAILQGSRCLDDYGHINADTLEPLPAELNKRLTHTEWIKSGAEGIRPTYLAGGYWNYGIIRSVLAENVAIIGERGSLIDGSNVYDPKGEEQYRGPHAIDMHHCKNLTFRGYTVENSSNWSHFIFASENMTFEDLTVLAGHDAIDIRACDHVRIENCTLMTGDDAVAGFDNFDVTVRNCKISSACSAFRFGGRDILVENCEVFAPCPYQFRGSFTLEEKIAGLQVSERGRNNMLSFWTNFVTDVLPPRMPAGNITVRNCTVNNADRMLHLNLSGNEPWQRGLPPTDITFENIKAEGIKMGLTAYATEECKTTLTLKNVDYTFAEGYEETPMLRLAHCREVNMENVTVHKFKGDALIRTWSDGIEINTENFDCDLGTGALCSRAEEAFVCKPI